MPNGEIKRYDMEAIDSGVGGDAYVRENLSPNGEWVRYDDLPPTPPKIAILWSSGGKVNWFFTADLTKRVFPAVLGAPPAPVYETRDPIVPLHTFLETVTEARRVWMAENPCEDGRDHVTPFDRFLYNHGAQR